MFETPVQLALQGKRDFPAITPPAPDLEALTASVSLLKQGYEALVGIAGRAGARAVRLDELTEVLGGSPSDGPSTPTDPIPTSTGMTEAQILARVSLGV